MRPNRRRRSRRPSSSTVCVCSPAARATGRPWPCCTAAPGRITITCVPSTICAPARAAWRSECERRFAAHMADPKIARARADLTASGLSRTEPEKYRRLAFALSVAPYFRDPNLAKQMTPFRVTARTQEAVWGSLGEYDLRPRLEQTASRFPLPRSLVVHGIYDPMPLEGARELAALLRTGVLELATGHAPHVEATLAFARALDGFLPHA